MSAELLTEDIKHEFEACVGKHSWENMSFSEPRQVLPGCWIKESNDPPSGAPIIIVWSQDTGCHEVHGGICQKWQEEGGANGRLGLPMSDEEDDPESGHSSARRRSPPSPRTTQVKDGSLETNFAM